MKNCHQSRVAEVGSFLARAIMAIKTFVKHVFTFFTTIRVLGKLRLDQSRGKALDHRSGF